MSAPFDVLGIVYETECGRLREVRRERGWVVLEHERWGQFAARLHEKGWIEQADADAIAAQLYAIYRMEGPPLPPDIPEE